MKRKIIFFVAICFLCICFFSCSESNEQSLDTEQGKSEACLFYEENQRGLTDLNDYRKARYLFYAVKNGGGSLIANASVSSTWNEKLLVNQSTGSVKLYIPYFYNKKGYLANNDYQFSLIEYCNAQKEYIGKKAIQLVLLGNKDISSQFLVENETSTGNFLTEEEANGVFDAVTVAMIDSLKANNIFQDLGVQPLAKTASGVPCSVCWSTGRLGDSANDSYTSLQVDVPKFLYNEKTGSIYFFALQYNLYQNTDATADDIVFKTIEGAMIYGGKKKFIYKDYSKTLR